MSDLMLNAVLRMPYEMAMADELSRRQFYDRAQQALDLAESLQAFENDVESNLKIAVSALKDIAETNASKHGTSQMMIKRCMFIANDALKEVK